MKGYEISATREHVVIKALCDNKDSANEVFTMFRANKENSIRARAFEHGKFMPAKYYGEDPDWDCTDEEWNYTYNELNNSEQEWTVSKIELALKAEETVGRFPSREAAIDWIAFEAQCDSDYGVKYVYTVDYTMF